MLKCYRKSRGFSKFLYFFIITNPPGYKSILETEGSWQRAWKRDEVGVSTHLFVSRGILVCFSLRHSFNTSIQLVSELVLKQGPVLRI